MSIDPPSSYFISTTFQDRVSRIAASVIRSQRAFAARDAGRGSMGQDGFLVATSMETDIYLWRAFGQP